MHEQQLHNCSNFPRTFFWYSIQNSSEEIQFNKFKYFSSEMFAGAPSSSINFSFANKWEFVYISGIGFFKQQFDNQSFKKKRRRIVKDGEWGMNLMWAIHCGRLELAFEHI